MTLVSRAPQFIIDNFQTVLNEVVEDEEIDSWFFITSSSSWVIIGIILVYLAFVLHIGPKLMKDRPPMNIKYIILAYNLFQTVYNAWIVSKLFTTPNAFPYLFNHSCRPIPRDRNPLFRVLMEASWYYLFSKITDLLDTVFFVLKKKQSHISFLHVYHHSNMVFWCWAYIKFIKGEQGVVIGIINSFVHVVMYSYYFLAALGPQVQKHLWWKKYITRLQLVQFAIILSYAAFIIINECPLPKALNWIMAFQSTVFSILFANFYYKAYIRSPVRKQTKQDQKQRHLEKHHEHMLSNNNNITQPEELAKKVATFTQS
uniref:Elongation of very long chain fatty acids protein n=1 Tax=Cacopsylla melanoneura TaxID=428564 RepID=A0A8D8WJQ1_9HEMI